MTTALVADDEPLLADALVRGLALADEWPEGSKPLPIIVFVTAFDEYALAAFDAQATDYVLKPVTPQRLAHCVHRLQARLAERQAAIGEPWAALAQRVGQLQAQLQAQLQPLPATQPKLTLLQSGLGANLHVVPVSEVLVIEAADRYLRILTAESEHLLRMPLHELRARLEPNEFWQIHRSVLVRASAMKRLERTEGGRLRLHLHGRPESYAVGRVYASQFAAM